MLQRLLGLETEYAIGVSPRDANHAPNNSEVYGVLAAMIERRLPTRPGERMLHQLFTVNGGSFSYESLPWARDAGLVEGATPECRSPGDALLYQRAQDALLTELLPDVERGLRLLGQPARVSLRKNCRDAEGNIYGAQENYEAEIASGVRLGLWRSGLVALVPLALVSAVAIWALGLLALVLALVTMLPYWLLGLASARVRESKLYDDLFGDRDTHGLERRVGRPFSSLERLLWVPTLWPFFWLSAALAFRRLRRRVLPFLVTRPVISGTGTLLGDDRLGLSEKGPAIVGVSRRSVASEDRVIWDGGNLCKSIMGLAMLRGRGFASLFRRRQRFQLGLSDSNVTQVAEFLKLGTTTLVLDMAEAGVLDDLPRLQRPVHALHTVVADPELRASIRWGQRSVTALEVQRLYWERARAFVRDSATPSLEAAEIVELWGRTLDGLERDPHSQVGRVDWVTKRFLLETAGQGQSWAVRKTIDLKMHELGPGGTLAGLEAAELAPRLVSEDDVKAAIERPPGDSPAQRRSRLIRELAGVDTEVTVYWDRVRVGGPIRGKVIRLDDHRGKPEP